MSVYPGFGQGTNNSIYASSPLKRFKTGVQGLSKKSTMKILTAKEQFEQDVKIEVFMKATTNPTLSKSNRKKQGSQASML